MFLDALHPDPKAAASVSSVQENRAGNRRRTNSHRYLVRVKTEGVHCRAGKRNKAVVAFTTRATNRLRTKGPNKMGRRAKPKPTRPTDDQVREAILDYMHAEYRRAPAVGPRRRKVSAIKGAM